MRISQGRQKQSKKRHLENLTNILLFRCVCTGLLRVFHFLAKIPNIRPAATNTYCIFPLNVLVYSMIGCLFMPLGEASDEICLAKFPFFTQMSCPLPGQMMVTHAPKDMLDFTPCSSCVCACFLGVFHFLPQSKT